MNSLKVGFDELNVMTIYNEASRRQGYKQRLSFRRLPVRQAFHSAQVTCRCVGLLLRGSLKRSMWRCAMPSLNPVDIMAQITAGYGSYATLR